MHLLLLGAVGGMIIITITRSSLFAPLRDRMDNVPFLGDLLHCPYCFGHWTGWLLAGVFKVQLFECHWALNWFASGLALGWVSILAACAVYRASVLIPLKYED